MLGFYSVNFLASMGAYLFLSGGSDLEPELSASEEFDLTFPVSAKLYRFRSYL